MPTILEHLFDIFSVCFFKFKFASKVSPKTKFFHSFYVDIIDVERKDVFNFIWHLKGYIFGFIFV